MSRNASARVMSVAVFTSLIFGAVTASAQAPSRENTTAGARAAAQESVTNAAGKAVVEIFASPLNAGDDVVPRAEFSNTKPRVANAEKRGSGIKTMFKELRPGSCRSRLPSAPNTSWPARGEAAIAFCQP